MVRFRGSTCIPAEPVATVRRVIADRVALVAFCPECARREFAPDAPATDVDLPLVPQALYRQQL
jgi:hypothetical protein